MTMSAPSLASARTIALPMPLLPPVTTATLPSRLMGCSSAPASGDSSVGLGEHHADVRQGRRGTDEREVRERLRRVPELALGRRVVLLREQPHVVRDRGELVEE